MARARLSPIKWRGKGQAFVVKASVRPDEWGPPTEKWSSFEEFPGPSWDFEWQSHGDRIQLIINELREGETTVAEALKNETFRKYVKRSSRLYRIVEDLPESEASDDDIELLVLNAILDGKVSPHSGGQPYREGDPLNFASMDALECLPLPPWTKVVDRRDKDGRVLLIVDPPYRMDDLEFILNNPDKTEDLAMAIAGRELLRKRQAAPKVRTAKVLRDGSRGRANRKAEGGEVTSVLPTEIDRLLLVSRQPDQRRAATGLATAFTKALAKLKHREGMLIAQLDELLEPYSMIVADQPFMPSEPVALCLTGTPRLVASVYSCLLDVTNARFARLRPSSAVGGLRVCAVAQDGRVTASTSREISAADLAKLKKAGWLVEAVDEEELSPVLVEAAGVLQALSGMRATQFAPGDGAKVAPGRAKPKRKSVLAGFLGNGRRKTGRRRSR